MREYVLQGRRAFPRIHRRTGQGRTLRQRKRWELKDGTVGYTWERQRPLARCTLAPRTSPPLRVPKAPANWIWQARLGSRAGAATALVRGPVYLRKLQTCCTAQVDRLGPWGETQCVMKDDLNCWFPAQFRTFPAIGGKFPGIRAAVPTCRAQGIPTRPLAAPS
jgi:hypothetical protein